MDASDTIIYVSQKMQTVPGHGKAAAVGLTVRETAKGCVVLQAGFLWLRIGVPTALVSEPD